MTEVTHNLNFEKGRINGMEFQIQELKALLQSAKEGIQEANQISQHYRTANSTISREVGREPETGNGITA